MERKHNGSLHRQVIDSARQLINQMQQKGRVLRRVFGGGRLPRAPGFRERERRRVGNVRADADAHRGTERDESGLI